MQGSRTVSKFRADMLRLRLASRQLGWMQLPPMMSSRAMPPLLAPLIMRLSAMSSAMYPAFVLHQQEQNTTSDPASLGKDSLIPVCVSILPSHVNFKFSRRNSALKPRTLVPLALVVEENAQKDAGMHAWRWDAHLTRSMSRVMPTLPLKRAFRAAPTDLSARLLR